jgi:hypothetical protein
VRALCLSEVEISVDGHLRGIALGGWARASRTLRPQDHPGEKAEIARLDMLRVVLKDR